VELSEPEIWIYCDSLVNFDADRLNKAMQRCLNECDFMPKLKDIQDRMPEKRAYTKDTFIPVSDHFEPYTETDRLHVWLDANGNRRVKVEPGVKPEIARIGKSGPKFRSSGRKRGCDKTI
jgi:hypothetical protein